MQPFKLVKLKGRDVVARVLDMQSRDMSLSASETPNATRVRRQERMVLARSSARAADRMRRSTIP